MSDARTTRKDNGTLAEQGKHIAHNMAEVFDISSQIWQTVPGGAAAGGRAEAPPIR